MTDFYEATRRIKQAQEENATKVDLSELNLGLLPKHEFRWVMIELHDLTRLETLNLRCNLLDRTDLDGLGVFADSLRALNLSGNSLDILPWKLLRELKGLEALNLSGNELSSSDLQGIKNLKPTLIELELSYNQLTSIPKELFELEHLELLDLSGNQLKSAELKGIGKLKCCLRHLYLCDSGFECLPKELFELEKLELLDLTGNHLKGPELDGIRKLKISLKSLYLGYNWLTDLPMDLFELEKLEKLHLFENRLSGAYLRGIEKLSATLMELSLGGCPSMWLPKAFKELDKLEELSVTRVKLRDVDLEAICKLKALRSLELNNCELTTLPESLVTLPALKQVSLGNNELLTPPQSAADKGLDAVREWFVQQKAFGSRRRLETKILILGDQESGKTTLRKKLKNLKYFPKKKEPRTVGVDIWDWEEIPVSQDNDENILMGQARLYDFGGQANQRLLHYLFLGDAFTVIMSPPDNRDTIYDWLQSLYFHRKKQTIIGVANEFNGVPHTIDLTPFEEYFVVKPPINVHLLDTDLNRVEPHLTILKNQVAEHIKEHGEEVLNHWEDLKDHLRNEVSKPHISLAEYREYAAICKLTKALDQDNCLAYFHSLGYVFYFDKILVDRVFLDSNWLIKAVYTILAPDTKFIKDGYFQKQDLLDEWVSGNKDQGRPQYDIDETKYLFQILTEKGFGLIYQPDEDDEERCLIPYLLPDLVVGNLWVKKSNENSLPARRVHMGFRFLPEGVMASLAVNCHRLIVVHDGVPQLWKSGMVCEYSRAYAKLSQNVTKSYGHHVTVEVIGPKYDRDALERKLVNALENLVDTKYRMFPLVDCYLPCTRCESSDSLGMKWRFEERERIGVCPICNHDNATSAVLGVQTPDNIRENQYDAVDLLDSVERIARSGPETVLDLTDLFTAVKFILNFYFKNEFAIHGTTTEVMCTKKYIASDEPRGGHVIADIKSETIRNWLKTNMKKVPNHLRRYACYMHAQLDELDPLVSKDMANFPDRNSSKARKYNNEEHINRLIEYFVNVAASIDSDPKKAKELVARVRG